MSRFGCSRREHGRLVLIGGAEDKRDEMLVLRRLLALNRARRVAVVPTASGYPERRLDAYRAAFSSLGVEAVLPVDVRSRGEADSEHFVAMIEEADTVFFTGGDQVKLVDTLDGSLVMQRVRARFQEGMVVAGTSAGAAAAGELTIFDGDGHGFRKGMVRHTRGFGLLHGVVVDTHFLRRSRYARLAQFLSSGRVTRGIGIGEDTALVIHPDGDCEVVGRRTVAVLSADSSGMSSYHETADGEALTMDGIRLGFLAPGTIFNLQKWRIRSISEHRSDELSRLRA